LLTISKSAETLQVSLILKYKIITLFLILFELVKYELEQYYNFHHDYGTDRSDSRFLTFLMYLNTPEEGNKVQKNSLTRTIVVFLLGAK
jgi:hypothetical protein